MVAVTGMESKHLHAGADFPPIKDQSKLRLYSMRYCPYAERGMIALSVKEIPHEVINLNLVNKPEWYVKDKNPLGKVPTIELNGKVVYESLVVAEYLDDLFPQKRLLPTDPFERAHQRILVERLSQLPSSIYGLYRKLKESSGKEEAIKTVEDNLQLAQDLLKGEYYGGSAPSWADYMQWPWFERLGATVKLTGINMAKFPKLCAYIEKMKVRPEIQRVIKSTESHVQFFESAMGGAPNYDFESE